MIVRILSGIFFTDIGAKERYIGYLNFLGIPWNLKFLWAPFVDAAATKRRWMIVAQVVIAVLTAAVAATCAGLSRGGDASDPLGAIALMFVLMAFFSATNDIAVDAYYLEGLKSPGAQAAYSGSRVLAYRLAMIFARSGLVEVAALAGRWLGEGHGPYLPWAYAFGFAAVTMGLLSVAHMALLPRFEREDRARERQAAARGRELVSRALGMYGRAFSSYLKQDRAGWVLVFIIVYKLGDEILFSMVSPFLLRELQLSKDQLAWVGGIVGAAGSVVGTMIGGALIKRFGLRRTIWPLTLAMNVNILAYVWLAWVHPDPTTTQGIATIAAVHGYEQAAAGIGSAVLLVFLLGTCQSEHKAAHYAIGSAIMSLGSTLVGGLGGHFVETFGYLKLFLMAVPASIPSMILLGLVPLPADAPEDG